MHGEGTTTLDTTAPGTPPTLLTDHRAEFRLASDLKSAKEVNHELTHQVSFSFSFYYLHIFILNPLSLIFSLFAFFSFNFLL